MKLKLILFLFAIAFAIAKGQGSITTPTCGTDTNLVCPDDYSKDSTKADTVCKYGKCFPSECCSRVKKTCKDMVCPSSMSKKSDATCSYQRNLHGCETLECCEYPKVFCTNFDCKTETTHQVLRSDAANRQCPYGRCTNSVCCQRKAKCSTHLYRCPEGRRRKANYYEIFCSSTSTCNADECCKAPLEESKRDNCDKTALQCPSYYDGKMYDEKVCKDIETIANGSKPKRLKSSEAITIGKLYREKNYKQKQDYNPFLNNV